MTRKSSGVDVQHAIPIVIGLACGIYAFSVGVPRLVTQLTGVEGSFTAERCTWELDSEGETQGECEGSFTASDGSFTIRPIESEGVFHSRPQEPVTRLVGGPSADKAVPPDLATSLVPMGFGLTASAFPAWALTAATRDAAERRRRRRAWPAAADLPEFRAGQDPARRIRYRNRCRIVRRHRCRVLRRIRCRVVRSRGVGTARRYDTEAPLLRVSPICDA